jgi:hypothetical protein
MLVLPPSAQHSESRRSTLMGLAWYGNIHDPAYCDDREPEYQIEVTCTKCGAELIWSCPMSYEGKPPKHSCGGEVKRRSKGK